MRIAAILLALLLGGCAQLVADQWAADDRVCMSYGVKLGDPGYAQCRAEITAGRLAAPR
jgi:hypothetical protein